MARNYSLVINSRFKPFSYEELLAPALMATQAHQVLEEKYSALAAQANDLYKKLDANRDKKSVATYNAYMSALNSLASELSKNGLNQGSRRGALNAAENFQKHIVPILRGYDRRAEAERAQQDMIAKDPTHFYARYAKDLSVDDFVDDQTLDVLTENYSGALLTKQSATAAANILRDNRKNGGLRRMGLPYYWEQEFANGKTEEQVVQAIMSKHPNDPFLASVLDTVMKNSGIGKWSTINGNTDDPTYQRALDYAKEGLYAAIGGKTWKQLTDQFGMQLGLLRQRQAASRGSGNNYNYRGMQSNPNYLYSTDKLNDIRSWEKNGWIKKGDDGKWHITDTGKNNLKETKHMYGPQGFSAFGQETANTAFGDFVESGRKEGSKVSDDAALQNALNDYADFADADAYREIAHDLYLNPAQQKAWKERLAEHNLSRVTFKGKGVGYEKASTKSADDTEFANGDDINWDEITPTRIRTTRYGNTVLLQDKSGRTAEFELPTNINQTFEQPIAKSIRDYYELSDLAKTGRKPVYERDNNGRVIGFKRGDDGRYMTEDRAATANDVAAIYAAADMAYKPANDYFMNIGGTWGVKPSDFQYGMIPTDPYDSVSSFDLWQNLGRAGDDDEDYDYNE